MSMDYRSWDQAREDRDREAPWDGRDDLDDREAQGQYDQFVLGWPDETATLEPLDDPDTDGAGAFLFLPQPIRDDLRMITVFAEQVVGKLEPLQQMRVGDVDEEVRYQAKQALTAGALALKYQGKILEEARKRVISYLDQVCLKGELVILEELGQFYVGDNPKVSFDNTRTASAFAARIADEIRPDPETGAYPSPAKIAEQAVTATAKALGGFAPGKAWNKGPLRERGLEPDDYVTSRERGPRDLREKQ